MKTLAILSTLVVCIAAFSCADHLESLPGFESLPSREIHYNFNTGQKVGEKTLTYDGQGRLTIEYYIDVVYPGYFEEVTYQYDNDGNLVKKTKGDQGGTYLADEFTFENGLKKSQESFFGGRPDYKTVYFYSGISLDSSQTFSYSSNDSQYEYRITTLFECDSRGRVIKTFQKNVVGVTIYTYQNDNLISTCNQAPLGPGETWESCELREYNDFGALISISNVSSGMSVLREESFYKEGKLDERKIYTYTGADPPHPTHLEIKLIRYEY